MPRKNPFPKREREICDRLREFRKHLDLTRVAFAKRLKVDSSLVSNYEHARSPVKAEFVLRCADEFFVNPVWLGKGAPPFDLGASFYDDLENPPPEEGALFSEYFDTIIAEKFSAERIWRMLHADRVITGLQWIENFGIEEFAVENPELAGKLYDTIREAAAQWTLVGAIAAMEVEDSPAKRKKSKRKRRT